MVSRPVGEAMILGTCLYGPNLTEHMGSKIVRFCHIPRLPISPTIVVPYQIGSYV